MSETKVLSPEEKKAAAEAEVNALVANGLKALDEFANFDQEKIDYIVAKMSVAGLDHHGDLARKAIEETKRGVFEDKATKNLFACEYVVNNMRHTKTVGIISDDPVSGITEIAEPVGVVAGITPVTNPTSTVIFKSLICIKTRNPIIFAFHPNAQQSSKAAAIVMKEAAEAAGAPKDCIQWIENPSMEATTALMQHPGVATILATGGNAMVKAAYSCGKPALGVGAGNVPCYINESCDQDQTVNDVVLSKAFDNGMICASESAVFIDESIYESITKKFARFKVYFASAEEKAKLEKFMFGVTKGDKNVAMAKLNPAVAGMSPQWIAEQSGFSVPKDISIIGVNCDSVGPEEPMSREKLSPILAFYKVKGPEEGFEKCEQMLEFGGLGHSAAIHCKEQAMSDAFGDKVKALRVIWNSPSTFGGIGNVYNSFLPSLTLGCGSYGHNSVGGNVSAINLLNIKKVGKRRNTMAKDNPKFSYLSIGGMDEAIAAIEDILSGKVHHAFIEMSSCSNSCINGPALPEKGKALVSSILAIKRSAGPKDFKVDAYEGAAIKKAFYAFKNDKAVPSESAIKEVLAKIGKTRKEDELNCSSCGYATCRDKAIAVLQGKANLEMCLPFLMGKAKSFSNSIVANASDPIVVLDESLNIQLANPALLSLVGLVGEKDLIGKPVSSLMDEELFALALGGENTLNKKIYWADYGRYLQATITYDQQFHILIGIFRDITLKETERAKEKAVAEESAKITSEVIEKNMA